MDQQHRRFLRHAIGGFGEVLRGIQRDSRSQHIGVTVLGHGVLQGERQGFPCLCRHCFRCGRWRFCFGYGSRFLGWRLRCFGRGLCRRLRWKRCFWWSLGWLRHRFLCRKCRCFRRLHFLCCFLCRWSLGWLWHRFLCRQCRCFRRLHFLCRFLCRRCRRFLDRFLRLRLHRFFCRYRRFAPARRRAQQETGQKHRGQSCAWFMIHLSFLLQYSRTAMTTSRPSGSL